MDFSYRVLFLGRGKGRRISNRINQRFPFLSGILPPPRSSRCQGLGKTTRVHAEGRVSVQKFTSVTQSSLQLLYVHPTPRLSYMCCSQNELCLLDNLSFHFKTISSVTVVLSSQAARTLQLQTQRRERTHESCWEKNDFSEIQFRLILAVAALLRLSILSRILWFASSTYKHLRGSRGK